MDIYNCFSINSEIVEIKNDDFKLTGKSFQSNATKFPHPGLHMSNISRLDPRKAQ